MRIKHLEDVVEDRVRFDVDVVLGLLCPERVVANAAKLGNPAALVCVGRHSVSAYVFVCFFASCARTHARSGDVDALIAPLTRRCDVVGILPEQPVALAVARAARVFAAGQVARSDGVLRRKDDQKPNKKCDFIPFHSIPFHRIPYRLPYLLR